jgi:6-pyruvoyltetrahydropterin/6-carboxytetrahydropterin synthase
MRYSFTAVGGKDHGRGWDCFVTVQGLIDPLTGMVTDIGGLNRLVEEHVIASIERQDLREAFGRSTVTGLQLAQRIWNSLAGRLSEGTLANVRLVASRDLSFDYAG